MHAKIPGVPLVHPCSEPGCSTLTMGHLCLEHEGTRAESAPTRSRRVVSAALVGAIAGLVAAFLARARLSL